MIFFLKLTQSYPALNTDSKALTISSTCLNASQ